MYQTNYPANPLGPADKTSTKVERLEQDVQKLKDLVEEAHKGLAGWAKRRGAILALFIALFAVPPGVVDAYDVFWSRPNTELSSGSVLIHSDGRATRNCQSGFRLPGADSVSPLAARFGQTGTIIRAICPP
jgi:hypothetical protein